MNSEAIVSKINKLLSLATSSNPAEAEAASAKAMELLARYNLTLGEVEQAVSEYQRKNVGSLGRNDPAWHFVSRLLRQHFFVEVVRFTTEDPILAIVFKSLAIMGQKHNVAIAEYMAAYLLRAFNNCWNEARRAHSLSARQQTDFYQGMWIALDERLEATREKVQGDTGQNLPVPCETDPRLQELTRHEFPQIVSRGPRLGGSMTAASAGQQAGSNLSLHRAVSNHGGKSGKFLN